MTKLLGYFICILVTCVTIYARADNSQFTTKSCSGLFSNLTVNGGAFLHQKNPNLHLSDPVKQAANRTFQQTGQRLQKPDQRIQNWLNYLENASKRADENLLVLQRVKNVYYKLYVLKPNEVPQSYYDSQVRIARERGHGDISIDSNMKSQLAETLINDQQKSLDSWIEYFVSKDSSSYPMWTKLWAFQGMVKLSKFNKETQSFGTRDKTTVAPFIELNREAFAFVIDAVTKKLNKESLDQIQDPAFLKLLDGFNFGKLYARALAIAKSTSNEGLFHITEGRWVTYPKGTDHRPLVKSLEGKNTGWCTAGEMTAKRQLSEGDFNVYYSLDQFGKPTIPRVAIRMDNSKIAEVRGVGKDQNLDSEISKSNVIKNKMKEFGSEAEKYQKKSNDMRKLTQIDDKLKSGQELSKEDLIFLYEIDSNIEGFGYQKDPRIEEILRERSIKKDLAYMNNVKESEVALTLIEAQQDHIRYVPKKVFFETIQKQPSLALKFIDTGTDINVIDSYTNTPLILAAKYGRTEIALKLIDKGADINAKNNNGERPLILALKNGHIEIALKLIDEGADFNIKDNYGKIPLELAIMKNNIEIALKLIDKGADINSRDKNLILASKYGRTEITLKLISRNADTNAKNRYGNTPLIRASSNGHTKIAFDLIDKGADINAKNNNGDTPLIHAIEKGHVELALKLIDKGADINAKNNKGNTPLTRAIENRHVELALKLIDKGADINDDIPLIHAIVKGQTELALKLIDKGADINAKNNFGETPLITSARFSRLAITHKLIEKGADVNAKNNFAERPLLISTKLGHTEVALKLIEKGADVNAKDNFGETPLIIAIMNDNTEFALKLIELGSDINATNGFGNTPLKLASIYRRPKIAQILKEHGAKE